MLTITRLQANRLRTVFSRAVGRSFRAAPVLFRSNENGLTVCIQGSNVAVECQIAGQQPVESFVVSLELLKKCEGSKTDPVTLQQRGKDVEARWEDGGVPQAMACDAGAPFELPPLPGKMEPNEPRLITALRDAADSTDDQSTRYALGCLQLRPESGRIAASDAMRLFVQQGFRFPWNGEVLIPGNSVFACRDLHGEPISIGRSEGWVTVRAGVWTIHLRIEKDARFPNVDSIIPDAASAESVLHLSDEDCRFLLGALPKLPAQSEPNSPVTCDFNGQVAIRGKAEDQPQATELVLSNSRLEGKPLTCLANRELLAHALRLGFRTLYPFPANGTVLCQDEHRQFVWMLLSSGAAPEAEVDRVRIASPVSNPAAEPSPVADVPRIYPRSETMPTNRVAPQPEPAHAENGEAGNSHTGNGHTENGHTENGHATNGSPMNGGSDSSSSAVERLITLRDTLKAAVVQTNDAIRLLKRQRREDRLLRSTLSSLRQLQNLAG